jgi:hypothetical protein
MMHGTINIKYKKSVYGCESHSILPALCWCYVKKSREAIGRNELQVFTVLNHSVLLLWHMACRTEVVSALNVTQTDL